MPCPVCKCEVTLRQLKETRTRLTQIRRFDSAPTIHVGNIRSGSATTITVDSNEYVGASNGSETWSLAMPYAVCARCGAVYNEYAAEEADVLLAEITRLRSEADVVTAVGSIDEDEALLRAVKGATRNGDIEARRPRRR